MSEEESQGDTCRYCDESFEPDKHEYLCNDCCESVITIWTCQRCDSVWSPDYYTEACYSDCCHPMMEGYNVDIESIKYCEETWDTVWDDDTSCKGCNEDEKKCKDRPIAYKSDKCKLMDYI